MRKWYIRFHWLVESNGKVKGNVPPLQAYVA